MIHLLSSIWSAVTEVQETKILFLGPSNSGKSALFERFKIILDEGPEKQYCDDPELEKKELEKDKDSSGLGGLASIKAELEKRKLLEEEARKRKERRDRGEEDENDLLSEDDKKELEKFKHVPPLPRFMSPTVGLNVGRGHVTLPHSSKKISALLWDTGGDPDLRQLWFTYIVQCHGVVYCIDLSADEREQAQSVKLLHLLMQRPELAFAPFLIVGTKMDVVIERQREEWKNNNRRRTNSTASNNSGERTKNSNDDDNDDDDIDQSSLKNQQGCSSSGFFERDTLQKTLTKFHRLLRFEDLPLQPSFLHDTDLINTKTGNAGDNDSASNEQDKFVNSSSSSKTTKKSLENKEDFVPVDVDSLLADDAVDAVNAVPGSSVSGICGHMYHCAVANSKDLKFGSDLRDSLYWILSASQSSRARSATLHNLEVNLSEKRE